jgi:hypothetical protein
MPPKMVWAFFSFNLKREHHCAQIRAKVEEIFWSDLAGHDALGDPALFESFDHL